LSAIWSISTEKKEIEIEKYHETLTRIIGRQ
jgi:hypothetical protein